MHGADEDAVGSAVVTLTIDVFPGSTRCCVLDRVAHADHRVGQWPQRLRIMTL